jgi:ribosomal protein S12 methylthiotransferase
MRSDHSESSQPNPSPAIGLPIAGAKPAFVPGAQLRNPPVVAFVSLGCSKNLVDSERMLGDLAQSGAILSGDESAADTIVVNTCGFLEAARTEAMEIIGELAERKRRGDLRRIVVAGCLVQRDGEKIREAIPEVDALVGVNNRGDIVRAVWRMDRDESVETYLGDYHSAIEWSDQGRLRLTPRHYAYLRISEGCNQKCTFCTIPSIRGPMHCKTPDELVAEGRELIVDGTREILLLGQDTTSYGSDIGFDGGLAALLRHLDRELDGLDWLRLMYVYPSVFTDRMIDAIAECDRIVKYIDIPLQHASDRVLKRMHRRVTRKQQETLLGKLRARIPGVTIRTTFIVGFPGETETDFEELLAFVRDFGFDAAGGFKYSLEPETPAGRMKEQVPEEVKEERYERFMLAQQDVCFAKARAHIGRAFDVLVDGENEDGNCIGRHAGQAPEVDGVCLMPETDIEPGLLIATTCTDVDGYDLIVQPE